MESYGWRQQPGDCLFTFLFVNTYSFAIIVLLIWFRVVCRDGEASAVKVISRVDRGRKLGRASVESRPSVRGDNRRKTKRWTRVVTIAGERVVY